MPPTLEAHMAAQSIVPTPQLKKAAPMANPKAEPHGFVHSGCANYRLDPTSLVWMGSGGGLSRTPESH